jgi:asparagine synthase (glutamine-hydrolysing)
VARVRRDGVAVCGVAGVVGEPGGDLSRVKAQLELLTHRGSDACGVFESGPGCIGQTRLAVIDLHTGDPPITNEDGRIGVILNGEIYNFRALRDELSRRGHRFRTQGDTEVLAHLVEDVAPAELARRLDGMFAFAVWDGRRLLLGRDRMGKKPLYYWSGGGKLVFASEIKAVLASPWVPRDLDPGAIDAYLTFGYVPTPRTFFAGVRSLPPAHIGCFEPGCTDLRLERYWSMTRAAEAAEMTNGSGSRQDRLLQLLTTAVTKRMVADVPMGAFLSGGIDSSTIVALMSEHSERPVATFTIGFEDADGFDERPYARAVAHHLGTEHTEYVVRPDAAQLIDGLIDHHDQPFGDSSALPTYLLSELTRRHVTVALCGDGGDEVFAGYERFAAATALAKLRLLPSGVGDGVARALDRLPPVLTGPRLISAGRLLRQRHLAPHRALLSWVSYTSDEWRARLRPEASAWGFDDYERLWESSAGLDLLGRLQVVTMASYLTDDLLVKVDRMSMAHALEVRSPFLDADVAAFGLSLPAWDKAIGLSQKRVLKKTMASRLPAEVLRRPKRGFGVPLDRWFRTELRPYLRGALGSPRARVRAHVEPTAVDALLAEHDTGAANHGHTLWTLLTLELFLQREKW